jgi:hypothetical protein
VRETCQVPLEKARTSAETGDGLEQAVTVVKRALEK